MSDPSRNPHANALPKQALSSPATTENCKALLEALDASAYPKGQSAGRWKRLSKSGSGARIERAFSHESGLFALLVQTPSELRVERLGASQEELASPRAPSAAGAGLAESLEARAPQSGVDQARAIMGEFYDKAVDDNEEELDDEQGAWARARELINAAALTSAGSPLRLAVGNLLEFHLPGEDWDGAFLISFINNWIPGDQEQGLEAFFDHVAEAPSGSTEHVINLDPQEAILFLLERGVRHSPRNHLRPGEIADPAYAGVMTALEEKTLLSASLSAGKVASSKPL